MGRLFNIDGPVFSFLSRMADLMWLNLLFIVCSIPIVTIGASTTAMHYVCLKMARDEDCYIAKSFFKSFKENFKQSTIIWLLIMIVGAVLLIDLRILAGGLTYDAIFNNKAVNTIVLTAIIICFILIVLLFTWVFPTLAQFDNTIKNILKNSLFLGLRHLPISILLIVVLLGPFLVLWFKPQLLIFLIILFALQAFISANILAKIFNQYMPEKEEVTETVKEEDIDYSILGARPIEDKSLVKEISEKMGELSDNSTNEVGDEIGQITEDELSEGAK